MLLGFSKACWPEWKHGDHALLIREGALHLLMGPLESQEWKSRRRNVQEGYTPPEGWKEPGLLCVSPCAVALKWVVQGILEGINSIPSEFQSPRGTNKLLWWGSNIQLERCEVVLRRKKHSGIKDKLEALMSGRCQGHKRFFGKGKKDVSSCWCCNYWDFISSCLKF